ncbi:IS5 family transposase [Cytophagaceae bacterium ABcell3]|nr:IS5 family transposase [Cytophagaceae bacterium ABcell3]WMJ72452.1 IS5 family transposase [Cytophagaceae bacterium ABcell3]WMJ72771.1 IS5 family transposase [Cytophagaceae bacterium ABcell3]WMJ73335.1 IS5 family transposase [Cytophagaceae bacterium ABcell3]WMJ73363.1 IS5 family transposase [Cytophagaceae bacterium ABcell3]
MQKTPKRRAPRCEYSSPSQLSIIGFETPFHNQLDPNNRWVLLSNKIPWDELVNLYNKRNPPKKTGRPALNPRVLIGVVIIKHILNLDDRETVAQITENMYLQYFLGYSSYIKEPPFDPSLFVDIRKRLGQELINAMNERIHEFYMEKAPKKVDKTTKGKNDPPSFASGQESNKGEAIFDATACPQDIIYPTDLGLLNKAREITQQIIDELHCKNTQGKKPRTYRKIARKTYLKVAQNKNPSRKVIRKGIKAQLQYLRRNFKTIEKQLDSFEVFPLCHRTQRSYWVIQTLYEQQLGMFKNRGHHVADRIVSIHQPHVRPIVRGKSRAKTEFGAKIHLSMVDGFSFLDTVSWEAFNEGSHLVDYVEKYRKRFGFYPAKVLADKIYCTRENRKWLKGKGIKLAAKPLGRPSAKAVENHVSPGERNPVEGKFGQAKNSYGMNRIRARLKNTSQTWIASIILVLNLVKLTRQALYFLSFSAWHKSIFNIIRGLKDVFERMTIKNRPGERSGPVFYIC